MKDHDDSARLAGLVRQAYDDVTPLEIQGGGTRRHLGREPVGTPLSLAQHTGLVEYEPSEFVVSVRAGTSVADLEAVLAKERQVLSVDMPRFSGASTIGGALAVGFTGPGRPYSGALRDAVLGVRVISGTGEVLNFGGKVLKNVAGFDVSRLMVGAFGTLGIILDVSLRLATRPEAEAATCLTLDWPTARAQLKAWEGVMPVTAAYYEAGRLSVRLAGDAARVEAARRTMGGDAGRVESFDQLRDLSLGFFRRSGPLWRLLVPPETPWEPAETLIDWAGAQRFWVTDQESAVVVKEAERHGGQAMRVWGGPRDQAPWAVPPAATLALMTRVKSGFDPRFILNRGRLYPDW